jgi:mRNA-degrading endonuclease RelE of RelBE toxin-antitoxin system
VSSYSVEVKPAARKELEALRDNVLTRIVGKIESLGDVPRPTGCKKLRGY